ncbi:uncharacterized protein LOC120087896 [Benincasa hispida]|uniref:uncharacterized protein LOC120087896 n=1 Tax=Benincasa hispida TaxID=102211 RepID=UPI001901593F|nr:uncharacterized protein LOC120087896 [Benincasa hispida]
MSLVNPSAGRAFIWIVTCFLFFSIISGGGCLLMYMILPETETTAWLPVAGLSLVCLPWFFWLLTFFYRVISRACGFRVSIGIGVDVGADNANANNNNNNNNASAESPRHDGGDRVDEEDDDNGDQRRSNSSSNNSIASRESEMPLAITMGS